MEFNEEVLSMLRTIDGGIDDLDMSMTLMRNEFKTPSIDEQWQHIKDVKEEMKEVAYQLRRNNDLIEKLLNKVATFS